MRLAFVPLALVLVGTPLAGPAGQVQPIPAAAHADPFITAAELDLTKLLPGPPAPAESPESRAELAEVLRGQVTRTPEMEARAVADGEQSFRRFADVLGPKLQTEDLPQVSALFGRLLATEAAVVNPSKAAWGRLRPHQVSELVRPLGRLSTSGSYPSGHATLGMLMGIVLADMVPEQRAAIFRRAREYGANRLVAGNHFPTDIAAGRTAAAAIAAVLMRDEGFKEALAAARSELRAALDLPLP